MSGIATLTSQFVAAVADFGVQVLDTRKIAPGLRALDKYAVWAGGGTNHRMNLAAMVLLKDGTQDRRLRVLPQRQRQVQGKAYRTA